MIKKILLALACFILAHIVFFFIPVTSIIKNETASDTVMLVAPILLALSIYKFLKPKLIK